MVQAPNNPPKQASRRSAPVLIGLMVLIAQVSSLPPAAAVDLPDAAAFGIRVEQGDLETVAEWLEAGLDPNFESDRLNTGLMIAAGRGDIAMMELLVKHGADVNRTNRFQEQALMHAAWKGQREAAAWLLERGARINRDGKEWSALHYAVFAGHEEVAKFLLQKGADINAKSTNGSTVLMMAAHEGKEKIAAMLLEAGADSSTKNDWGEDALTWAMRYQHTAIAKMVTSAGEFAQAAAQPIASSGKAVGPLTAPAEVEDIPQQSRLAYAVGNTRVLSNDEYRKVLARVARLKPAAIKTRLPKRLSITARRGDPSSERVELQYR